MKKRSSCGVEGRKLNDPTERFSGSLKISTVDGKQIPHEETWMAKCLRERRGFNDRELIIETPAGERRVLLVNVNPFLEQDGTLLGAVAVLVDISRQRRAELELRESERFARSVVNSLSSHIAIVDEAGTVLSTNAAWDRFAEKNGARSNHFGVGLNYLTVCRSATGSCGKEARLAADGIVAVLNGTQPDFYLEYPCDSPTQENWFALAVTPFEGAGPKRAVISHENITARKIAERLATEQLSLREAVAGMEQVLGVVGHELRTPLAALRAIGEFLLTDGAKGTAESDRFLREMSQEVDRMSDTVNNLLEAARLNSGRAVWNWSEFDLVETTHEAVESIIPLINTNEIRLVSDIEPAAARMLGDADAVRRLLINLLSNARKHTVHGTIDVAGQKLIDHQGTWIELSVTDTGHGIPEELLTRLGEAFALNSGIVGNNYVSGTGLGLAICKGIAAAHGGELVIKSTLGQGTTVTARLRADLDSAVSGETAQCFSSEAVAA